MTGPPIFIVGAPRSGTSLLRQMLNRHPGLAICGETHFFRLVHQKRRQRAFGDLSNPTNRRRLVAEYIQLPTTRELGVSCEQLGERLMSEATSYPAMFTSILRHFAESKGKSRFGEKTPWHSFFVETLCEWFPGAAILHLVRDPRDVAASLLRMPFGSSSPVFNARIWLRHNLAARGSSHRPGYLEVRYESLVSQPEQELTRICQWIGEEYVPSMLTPEQAVAVQRHARDRYQTPLTTQHLCQWRRELTARQAAQIEWALGPQVEAFGYRREVPPPSRWTILGGASSAAGAILRRTIPNAGSLWYRVMEPTEIARQEYWIRRGLWKEDDRERRT